MRHRVIVIGESARESSKGGGRHARLPEEQRGTQAGWVEVRQRADGGSGQRGERCRRISQSTVNFGPVAGTYTALKHGEVVATGRQWQCGTSVDLNLTARLPAALQGLGTPDTGSWNTRN